jgi:EAL domain-containing protein (putative c-di-GMP-specific phosphodiesterase class I)
VLARDQTFAFSFAFHAARLGVRLAVNDFGLRFYADGQLDALQVQLDALQVEDVKIDSWLVARVADHAPSAATVARIVELARAKGRRTIALDPPGPDTLDALRDLGVDCAQAFDLSQPSSAQA